MLAKPPRPGFFPTGVAPSRAPVPLGPVCLKHGTLGTLSPILVSALIVAKWNTSVNKLSTFFYIADTISDHTNGRRYGIAGVEQGGVSVFPTAAALVGRFFKRAPVKVYYIRESTELTKHHGHKTLLILRKPEKTWRLEKALQLTKDKWNRNIVLFLTSQTVSLFGSYLVQYAIMWHITLRTQSGIMMTIAIICGFLPTFLFLPLPGYGPTALIAKH